MWLCVHDPADQGKVTRAFSNWPATHWEFDFTRHGSPVLDRDVLIVSGGAGMTRFPLFTDLESADFVMFYFEGDNPEEFGPGQHYVTLDQLPPSLRNATAERAVVAIEFTTQNPANSNAVQRFGRIEDHAALGIPFLLVSPIDSVRLRTSAGIAGGHGDNRLILFQRQLIQNNRPTTEATLSGQVVGGCPFDENRHPPQGISQWTEQFLMVQGDSHCINAAHLTLPRMWSCIHDSYRYSGSQLNELYEFMQQVMEDTEVNGIITGRTSTAWDSHISATASRARVGNRGNGALANLISNYGQNNRFTVGSIRQVDDVFTNQSANHHYLFRAKQCTPNSPLGQLNRGGECFRELNATTLANFCQGFNVSNTIMSSLVQAVMNRHFLITRRLQRIDHLSKDTYTGGMAVTDWLFTRSPASHWSLSNYPRAVSNNPQNRVHIYAVEGPFSLAQVLGQTTDVYGRRTRARMDLYRCSDGVFLGQPLADLLGVPFMTPLAN
ncbi:MAG: hypothetical protein P8Q90_04285 [Candidatus Thalassarchaeaceae archaeon]|nr:hypothetical protein [Candidatus Thalassarchaeaceae archaeon]